MVHAKRSFVARSGVDWVSFAVMLFAIVLLALALARQAARTGRWAEVILLVVVSVGLIIWSARLVLKQAFLERNGLVIRYVLPMRAQLIPYENIAHADFFPHVYGSGPRLALHIGTAPSNTQKIRISLRKDPELFIAALQELGVKVIVHESPLHFLACCSAMADRRWADARLRRVSLGRWPTAESMPYSRAFSGSSTDTSGAATFCAVRQSYAHPSLSHSPCIQATPVTPRAGAGGVSIGRGPVVPGNGGAWCGGLYR